LVAHGERGAVLEYARRHVLGGGDPDPADDRKRDVDHGARRLQPRDTGGRVAHEVLAGEVEAHRHGPPSLLRHAPANMGRARANARSRRAHAKRLNRMAGPGYTGRDEPDAGTAPMSEPQIRFDDGAAYERMMGTWSRLAGAVFLDWLKPAPGLRWVDVG